MAQAFRPGVPPSFSIQLAPAPTGRKKVQVSAPGTKLPTSRIRKGAPIRAGKVFKSEALQLDYVVDMSGAGTVSSQKSIGTYGCGPCVGVIALSPGQVTCLHIAWELSVHLAHDKKLGAAVSREKIANLIPATATRIEYCSMSPNYSTVIILAALRYAHPHAIYHQADGIYFKDGVIRSTRWSLSMTSDSWIKNERALIK